MVETILRPGDLARINVNQAHEIRYWTQKLLVSESELCYAVRIVGASVERVREFFGINGGNPNTESAVLALPPTFGSAT